MKKFILVFAYGMLFQTGFAQGLPKWADKAKKAVFSVITYTKDNKILNTGNGFYIDPNGTAVSDYSLFKGADHAVVVTADGKELPVKYIMGANDMYDVVKFRTEADKKLSALQPATQAAKVGETVYLLPYATQKSDNGQSGTIARLDTIATNSFYYTIDMSTTPKTVSCPIMNANGEVIGLIQKNADETSKESYAIGINYARSLAISALSINDMSLNSIGIKKGLPEDESQAQVYLIMASNQLDENSYFNLLNDFIATYPNNMEGYLRRATYYMNKGEDADNALADADLKKMKSVADKKEDACFNIGKLIYSYQLHKGDQKTYGDWTYERALNEINEAISLSDQPIFHQTLGDIYFAMQKYQEAYEAYMKVNKSNLVSAATYYSAAKAKELTEGSDKKEVIALMDSAVACYAQPYGTETAPYLYERARVKMDAKDYREAVKDYNAFYDAMKGQVNGEFYVARMQAELQGRMYKQALDDVNKAVELEPNNSGYWAEKGGAHMRVNQLKEATAALEKAIALDAKNAPAYRMLGYTQIQQKKEQEGLGNLKKAKELGDEIAEGLIQKYSK
ncbi:trypsin-like peptidase domain-containing protein [uncultured Bacteroides sp.]|uniref:trypsin-like peptidase domain-containing protein n=1 Tax=uncultured Bacteroides sp. TaxID=162156 RepID=UPI002635EE73|nr:trypsin-like peptidase domain-containing protein [uncultured Bacteroides sp.]